MTPFIDDIHYLLALLPPLAIVLAIGAARAPGRWLLLGIWAVTGLGVAISPTLRAATSNKIFLPWPEVVTQLQGSSEPKDRLVFALPEPDPDWLHLRVADYYLHNLKLDVRLLESLPDTTPQAYDQALQKLIKGAQRLWIAFSPDLPPSTFARETLKHLSDHDFVACEPAYTSSTLALNLYARVTSHPAEYTFDNGAALDLVGGIPATINGPTSFFVRSSVTPGVPFSAYSIAIHVLDLQGQIRAQMDYGLPGDSPHCHRVDIPALPDGDYTITALVYEWQTGVRVSGTDADSGQRSDTMALGQIAVTSTPQP